jgi:cysteine-rich repeat protein
MTILKNLVFASLLAASLASCTTGSSISDLDRASESEQGDEAEEGRCAFGPAYWKNHPAAWSLASITIGGVDYTKLQLLAILEQPVRDNGLVALAHQLIAARLNIANRTDDGPIAGRLDVSDATIADRVVPPVGNGSLSPAAVSELVHALDAFNTTGECEPTPPPPPSVPVCGNGIVESGEQCDDGDGDDHDACSNSCTLCPATEPGCGNGVVEPGEECDDGNTNDSDGCSNTCHIYIG